MLIVGEAKVKSRGLRRSKIKKVPFYTHTRTRTRTRTCVSIQCVTSEWLPIRKDGANQRAGAAVMLSKDLMGPTPNLGGEHDQGL